MQLRPDLTRLEFERPVYHVPPSAPDEDPQGALGAVILRELLALPPGVLNLPVFRKVKGPLETYRKNYVEQK